MLAKSTVYIYRSKVNELKRLLPFVDGQDNQLLVLAQIEKLERKIEESGYDIGRQGRPAAIPSEVLDAAKEKAAAKAEKPEGYYSKEATEARARRFREENEERERELAESDRLLGELRKLKAKKEVQAENANKPEGAEGTAVGRPDVS